MPRSDGLTRDVGEFLQRELEARGLTETTAVEAAKWLDEAGLLRDSPSRPGKPLRDLLRAGVVQGAEQHPSGKYGRWTIRRLPPARDLDAGRKGKAVEHLVAASCILASGGMLNVSTSLVDDERVDLVFHLREQSRTLAVQVKSRDLRSATVSRGKFLADVRQQTFRPRPDLYLLFVAVDASEGTFELVWLVPSEVLAERVAANRRGRLRFSASMSPASRDRWSPFRLTRPELPRRVVEILRDLP